MKTNSCVCLLFIVAVLSPFLLHAQVGINATNTPPHPSAILDVSSTTKGMLAPRMTEAQRLAIITPANGLIVYQTNATRGYWYYDTNIPGWTNVFSGSEPWTLNGNTGTNPATQFLGTTNNQDLAFGANAAPNAVLTSSGGRLQIGPTGATERVQIEGGLKQTGTSAANTQGAVRWNATDNVHEGNIDGTVNGWYPLENVFTEQNPAQYAVQSGASCSTPPGGFITIGSGTSVTLGTVETPWGTFWEDNKVQYLWRAADLAAANICPNEDITAVGFNGVVTGTAYPQADARLGMLQTTASDLAVGFETGTVNLWNGTNFSPVNGWNQFSFSTPFQWNGSSNLVVEYSFDNCDWLSNEHIRADVSTYAALYGMFCDACGGPGGIGSCAATSCPNCPGNPCGCDGTGGNDFTNATILSSCYNPSCGFSFQGGQGPGNKRPQIRFYALTGTNPPPVLVNSEMIFYNGGLMVGQAGAAWAGSGAFGNVTNPLRFQGPGTVVAQNAVWGGGTLLNDYVFDIYFDGEARAEDMPRAATYQHLAIDEMVNYVEKERHLPTIAGREEWEKNGQFSLDDLSNQMWVTVEEQALYIKELNERMKLLQEYLIQQKLEELK